jgi:ferredoxin
MSAPFPESSGAACTIRLEPSGQTLACAPGQTLWQALQAAGRAWPVSCRNGTCRTCIAQLSQGSVRYRIEWPGLLPEEKAEGWVLPCVAYPQTDLVLLEPAGAAITPGAGAA